MVLSSIYLNAQVSINGTGAVPNGSAMLDVSSPNKGFLMPRMSTATINAIPTPATGLMVYNTQTDEFNYFDGSVWKKMSSSANNFWNITGTSIFNNNTGNVGIGDSSPMNAKLEVSGAVNGQVALFKSISGVSIDGTTAPSIGFNYNNGNAISTGAGGLLSLETTPLAFNSGSISLDFYKSKNAGTAFSAPKTVFKFQDFTNVNLGNWLDLNNIPDSRINVSDRMYSKSNGNMNLIPIGAIHFNITGMDKGTNATVIVKDVGNTANLYNSQYQFIVQQGDVLLSGLMLLRLNLDFITKDYQNVYLVGAPNFNNIGENTHSSSAEFQRQSVGTKDRIQITYSASLLKSSTEVFGTLLIYGTKSD
jgi:hypothetical protein